MLFRGVSVRIAGASLNWTRLGVLGAPSGLVCARLLCLLGASLESGIVSGEALWPGEGVGVGRGRITRSSESEERRECVSSFAMELLAA